jgi:hypothetical protein
MPTVKPGAAAAAALILSVATPCMTKYSTHEAWFSYTM